MSVQKFAVIAAAVAVGVFAAHQATRMYEKSDRKAVERRAYQLDSDCRNKMPEIIEFVRATKDDRETADWLITQLRQGKTSYRFSQDLFVAVQDVIDSRINHGKPTDTDSDINLTVRVYCDLQKSRILED